MIQRDEPSNKNVRDLLTLVYYTKNLILSTLF